MSDIPIFREIGGDAAAYVDPDDARGFARAVRALSEDAAFATASAAARGARRALLLGQLGAHPPGPRRTPQAARRSRVAVTSR